MAENTSGFTERYVAGLRVKPGQIQTDYLETNRRYRGLAVRVSKSGLKTWTMFYSWGGRRVRMTLGTFPAVSVSEAHRRAVEARSCLDALPPKDPREAMAQAAAAGMTVQRLIDAYAEHLKAKRLRSAPAMERTLRREVVPVIGRVSLAELHRRDINRVTDAILARGKNVAACRCFTIMHGLFSWSVGRGDFEHNPMEKMNRPPVDYTPRQRVLTAAEIRTLWHGLAGFAHERVLKLCLATGCRVGEAAGLPRAELDLAAKTWTLPAARSKNKCEHTLPLSSLALEIIEGYAFDNPSPAKIARDMGGLPARLGLEHLTSHDLRRTCADHLSELGVDQITIGHVLNHRSITRASVTQRHYVVRTYLPEMARALEVWADRLRTIIQGDGA